MSEFSYESDLSTSDNSRKSVKRFPKMVQMKLDEVDGLTKETELPLNPTTQSGNEYPIRFDDDFYAYRKSTKWPPITKSWPRMDPMTPSTESPNSIIIADFNKKLDHALDDFDYKMSNQQERLNYYNNDFANRLKKIKFDLKIVSPKRTHVHTYKGPLNVLVTIGSGVGIILLLILIIYSARKKKSVQPGTVLSTGRVIGQGAVQQNQEVPMMAPGHGGAVPPNIGMPYSNRTLNEEPPPYPGDTVPLVNKNGFVEMGFQNVGVAIPTTANLKTEIVTESGKTVESLNVGKKKDGAGQGTRRSDDKESVKFVDEKSFHD